MPVQVRPATPADMPPMVDLLLADAGQRQVHDPTLWAIAAQAPGAIADALTFALTADKQPFRQTWLVAESDGRLVGLAHSMRLPVPPIYAGRGGDPGLLMPENFVLPDAPPGTRAALLDAAEADLRASGATVLLASHVCGADQLAALTDRGYRPLTLYLSKSGLDRTNAPNARAATEADIAGIVALSATNRATLHTLDPFWEPHPDADARFGAWMIRSLTLTDRDMLVTGDHRIDGYAIAQPASRLHFPPAHDIATTGVIDDFFHRQYADPQDSGDTGAAMALLQAAETALAARGKSTAFVVCPAAWISKIALLQGAGYRTAMVWLIRRQA